MKKKVLGLVHGDFSSHTVRVVEIAKALRKTGEFETVFSGKGECMKLAEKEGFPVIETRTLGKREIMDAMHSKIVPVLFNEENTDELFSEEDELLRREKPDIIIREIFRELGGIAAKKRGVYDVFVQQANICPYYHADFKPGNTPSFLIILPGDRAIKIPFTDFAPLIRIGERIMRRRGGKFLHKKAKELGLKIQEDCYEGAEADLVLLPDSGVLFPFKKMRENYKFIGPVMHQEKQEKPSWLESFANKGGIKVVTSCGNTGEQDRSSFFSEAFRGNGFSVAVYNNSGEVSPEFYRGNFDLGAVLDYADVFITHGGIGSTYLGLINGVPMIALYGHFEQQANGSQLKKLGVGVSLNPRNLNAAELREQVCEVASNPKYKQRALEISRQVKQESEHSLELAVKYIRQGYETKNESS